MRIFITTLSAVAALLFTTAGYALDVKLTAEKDYIEVLHKGKMVRVERNQDQEHLVDEIWSKTSRKCPPFCIQPNSPADGVANVGEYEVFEFMVNKVNKGTGVIVDARLPSWHKKGTIPGSVNIPFTVFEQKPDSEELSEALKSFGAVRRKFEGELQRTTEAVLSTIGLFDDEKMTDYWDFTNVKDVLLWCNGPWCGQSPRAIHGLMALGFPAEKLFYYRGGMQTWEILGLTVVAD